jgi:putative membrane protein insertion efficiency factor
MMGRMNQFSIASLLIMAVRAYRCVSRFWPPQCRFYPSCSQYAIEAIDKHGTGRGLHMVAGRLSRCHPWHPGGLDPVL